MIALTFDMELAGREHRSELAPSGILDALKAAGARATFFVQGRWANCEPALARRIANEGHLVGNHSQHHAPMTQIVDIAQEVTAAEAAIRRRCGVNPKPWFRAPFGLIDERVEMGLEAAGYRHVGWDFHVADWEPTTTTDDIVRLVSAGIREHGPMVLLHGWPKSTAEALPRILAEFRAAEFVTVDQL